MCACRLATVIVVLLLGAAAATARAPVQISFDHPERFTDAWLDQSHREAARSATTRAIGDWLQQLGQRHLRPNQSLAVEVLDIDLAGEFQPLSTRVQNVRIMRSDTWPKIKLRYTLRQGGQVVISGEEIVADLYYLARADERPSTDPLRYEKAMLADWFHDRIVEGKPAPR
jgi:hypothetical protein